MTRLTVFLCVLAILGFSAPAFAITVTSGFGGTGATEEDFAGIIAGDGVDIIGDESGETDTINTIGATTSSGSQFGVFSDGDSAGIGMDTGIVLTTGNSLDITGTNTATSTTTEWNTAIAPVESLNPTYDDIYALTGQALPAFFEALYTFLYTSDNYPEYYLWDLALLEFDFTALYDTVSFDYVFASEEYNDFVGSEYNDVFGFFLLGDDGSVIENGATIPDTGDVVSINTVNNGQNSEYFNDNETSASYNFEFDGFTGYEEDDGTITPLEAVFEGLSVGTTYTLVLAVSDIGDDSFDSAVFIESGSLTSYQSTPVPEPATLLLLGTGLMGLAGFRKKSRK